MGSAAQLLPGVPHMVAVQWYLRLEPAKGFLIHMSGMGLVRNLFLSTELPWASSEPVDLLVIAFLPCDQLSPGQVF